ncbi:MAG: RNA 2',3'-cyclic phosphodiesterase [Endomicrobiales bacterium]|nr:RNA 2',3'-cyclic phosphodiesterase [Endomicrobiales bacterium]
MRLFIAINLPDEMKEALSDVQERLKVLPVDVSWVKKENFHITLKFLGEVGESEIPGIEGVLGRVCARSRAIRVVFSGLGVFPDRNPPRVVWAGISEGAEEIKKLASDIKEGLSTAGFQKEKRGFRAHLTLGRVRSAKNAGEIARRVNAMKDVSAGACGIHSVELMRSVIETQGVKYSVKRSYGLQKNV